MSVEARIKIENPKEFVKQLKALGLTKEQPYSFTDYVFVPEGKDWNLGEQSLKIRELHYGGDREDISLVKLGYVLNEWEGGAKVEKIKFTITLDSLDEARQVMKNWGFKELFHYSRKAIAYENENQSIGVAVENVDVIGDTAEIEAPNPEKLREILNYFSDRGLELKLIDKTIPEWYAELTGGEK